MTTTFGYVYLLGNTAFTDKYKIGFTYDLNKRLNSYKTGSPPDMKYVFIKTIKVQNPERAEKFIHQNFIKNRMKNSEWFILSSNELNNAKNLMTIVESNHFVSLTLNEFIELYLSDYKEWYLAELFPLSLFIKRLSEFITIKTSGLVNFKKDELRETVKYYFKDNNFGVCKLKDIESNNFKRIFRTIYDVDLQNFNAKELYYRFKLDNLEIEQQTDDDWAKQFIEWIGDCGIFEFDELPFCDINEIFSYWLSEYHINMRKPAVRNVLKELTTYFDLKGYKLSDKQIRISNKNTIKYNREIIKEIFPDIKYRLNNPKSKIWKKTESSISREDVKKIKDLFDNNVINKDYEDLTMKEKIIVHALKETGNIDIITWYTQQKN